MTNRISGALFLIIILTGACGGDTTGPARVRFPSTITATRCANGLFSLTANWQAVGTWKAIFTPVTGTPKIGETSAVDASQTKTSTCWFTAGQLVYAILFPVTVQAEADATPMITL